MAIQPALFKNGLLQIVDFMFKDPLRVFIILVVFAIIAWFVMKPSLNFDDTVWNLITFIFGVLIIVSFLFLVQKGFIIVDLKQIWLSIISMFST